MSKEHKIERAMEFVNKNNNILTQIEKLKH